MDTNEVDGNSLDSDSFAKPASLREKLLDLILKPQVVIAFITAIAGPITVIAVSNGIENTKIRSAELLKQRELQSQILTRIMDHASKETGYDTQSLNRISLLTDLVNDNHDTFGLSFPSIEEQINSKRRIEQEAIKRQLSEKELQLDLHEKALEGQQAVLQSKENELEKLKQDIAKVKRNRSVNRELNQKLAAERDQKQKQLDILKEQNSQTQLRYSQIEKEVGNKQSKIALLSEQIKEVQLAQVEKDEHVKGLNKKIEELSQALAEANVQIESEQKRVQEVTEERDQSQERVSELERELEQEKLAKQQLQDRVERLEVTMLPPDDER